MGIVRVVTCMMVTGLLALPASPQNKNGPNKKEGPPPHDMMWKDLNLTKEQRAKLKALHEEKQPDRKDQFEKIRAIRLKIKEETLKDTPDRAVLQGYSAEISEMHKQISENRIEHLLKLKQILTKEQFEKILDRDRRKEDYHNKKGNKPGGGPKRHGPPPDSDEE